MGKLADLAVLTEDYLTIPVDRIGKIRSVLTMVGGRIVHASDRYAALELKEKSPAVTRRRVSRLPLLPKKNGPAWGRGGAHVRRGGRGTGA